MTMSSLLLPLLTAHAVNIPKVDDKLPQELASVQLHQHTKRPKQLYKEDRFGVRDIVRVGSIGFKAVRSLNNPYTYDTPFPHHEIHGWKMMPSEVATKDNEALYITSHVPQKLFSRKRTIKVSAHFVIPKDDAPLKGEKKFIKLGFWIALSNSERTPEHTLFLESEEITIPDQPTFGTSNVKLFSATVEFNSDAQAGDLLYLLIKRTPVLSNEFQHPQGIALNSLTVAYQR